MKRIYLNRIKNLKIPIIFLAIICTINLFPQRGEYLLKAGYIEKFTHFIEWPETTNITDPRTLFRIAVIGENKFDDALEKIFNKVKVKDKEVKIEYISSVDEIKNCMILIISELKKDKLKEILNHTTGKPILTISDTKGFGKKGVIINMFIDNNHLRYEINLNSLDKSGLKISSLLLTSAIIIKEYD